MKKIPKTGSAVVKKLIEKGWITEAAVQSIFPNGVDNKNINVVEELLKASAATQDQMARVFSELFELDYEPLKNFRIDQRFYQTIPVELMYRYPFIPLEEKEGVLTLVISNPIHVTALDELEMILHKTLHFKIGTKQGIQIGRAHV